MKLVFIVQILLIVIYRKQSSGTIKGLLLWVQFFGLGYLLFRQIGEPFISEFDSTLSFITPFIWFFASAWMFAKSDVTKEDIELGFRINKKCPKCFKNLPSSFTTKCPHCTADL